MVHGGEVADRGERGLLRDLARDADRPVPRGAAGAVGHGDERGPQRLELADRPPQLLLVLVRLGCHELEGERLAAGFEQIPDGRRPPHLAGGMVAGTVLVETWTRRHAAQGSGPRLSPRSETGPLRG